MERPPAGKDVIKGEMIKDGDDRMVDWIWRLCSMAFENDDVPKDWRSAVIITECKNYKGIRLLSVVGKTYAGILVDSVCRMTGE